MSKETEAGEALYNALKNMPDTCTRTFPYSGKGKQMCQRCKALVLWEQKDGGESKTLKQFEATFI